MTPFTAGEAAWDAMIEALPAPHILQSHGWGAFKSRWGWRARRFTWGPPGAPTASAQVLVRRAGRFGPRVGYVPKGPLVAAREDPAAWAPVVGDLEAWARALRLAWLKIDADVPARAEAVAAAWRARGWRPSDEQVQFRNTMHGPLLAEDAQLAALSAKTRYNVRLAGRRGVSVRHAGAGGLDAFHRLYAETAARQGFAIRVRAYYLDAWRAFLAAGRATVILAEREGRVLAGAIPVALGDTAWYLYGASATEGRQHMGAYLAQWESLRWAHGRGCTRYDWWGGPDAPDEADPLYGVYRFKRGFGAELVEQLGAWDYPAWRPAWWLYRLAARARGRWAGRAPGG